MNSSRGKILVIRGGAIGDFILTLPVLAAVRARFPQCHLEVLGYPRIADLAVAGGLADRVYPIESRGLAGFFARHGNLSEDWRDYFSEFDLMISFLFDPDGIFRENVARCSPGQFIAGPHRPEERLKLHATESLLRPLERLAIFSADPVPRLILKTQPSSLNQLAVHPGSGSEKKNWPEERWSELLATLLQTTGFNLLLVGGEAEGERLQRLAAALPPQRTRVLMNAPLVELARRLTGSAGFIGHDSGITHLAAALGVPSLVLWGNTAEEIWRPLGEKVVVLRDPAGLEELSVARVIDAVRKLVGS